MTNKIEMTSQKKIVIAALISCFFLLIGLIMLGSNQSLDLGLADIVHSKTNATQVSYEYPWWCLSNGRVKTEITNTGKKDCYELINERLISGCENRTSNVVTRTYEESKTFGHTASAKVKAKLNLFEVEGGFTYTEAYTTKETTQYTINPGEIVKVWEYDIKRSQHDFGVTTTEQVNILSWFIKVWCTVGSSYSSETVLGYDGNWIVVK